MNIIECKEREGKHWGNGEWGKEYQTNHDRVFLAIDERISFRVLSCIQLCSLLGVCVCVCALSPSGRLYAGECGSMSGERKRCAEGGDRKRTKGTGKSRSKRKGRIDVLT